MSGVADKAVQLDRAVFAASESNDGELRAWLAPWQYSAEGKLIGAGVLDVAGLRLEIARVDYGDRRFRYQWKAQRAEGGLTGFRLPPWEIAERDIPSSLTPAGRMAVLTAVDMVWALMVREFQQQVAAGALTVWAKVGSPMAPYTRIAPKDWRHYAVTDWSNGVARAESGDLLFSVVVASPSRRRPIALSEKTCQQLKDQVKLRYEQGRPVTIPDFEELVQQAGGTRAQARELRHEMSNFVLKRGQKLADFERWKGYPK